MMTPFLEVTQTAVSSARSVGRSQDRFPARFESRRVALVLNIAQQAGTIGESAARLEHGFESRFA